MNDRDLIEGIMHARYAGSRVPDKRLTNMLAGLCGRYAGHVRTIRYLFDNMVTNRPEWWLHEPLFHIHVCCHIEQQFAPAEGLKLWLRHQSEQAWMEFLVQRKRDNALLREKFELAHAIMRDDPAIEWDKVAFKADCEGDAQ